MRIKIRHTDSILLTFLQILYQEKKMENDEQLDTYDGIDRHNNSGFRLL